MRYLKPEQVEEVRRLRSEGKLMKDIAKQFSVCEATISKICRGLSGPRKQKKLAPEPEPEPVFVPEDFSEYPDTVLFKHVRTYDFIG